MRNLVIAMRTAPRRVPYVGQTIRALVDQGVTPADVHLFPTAPDVAWLHPQLVDLPITLHLPSAVLSPNANGRRLVTVLDDVEARWLLMLEDDLVFCADFLGSVERWLSDHATPDYHVYRFCALGRPLAQGETWATYPLREQRGSQAIALRAEDARACAAWASARPTTWRPAAAPFQHQPHTGFDKLVGYWALATWPLQPAGLVSRPQFVRHVGQQSSLHGRGLSNDDAFVDDRWSYRSIEVVA